MAQVMDCVLPIRSCMATSLDSSPAVHGSVEGSRRWRPCSPDAHESLYKIERSLISASTWLTNDIIERRGVIYGFVEYTERIAPDKDASRSVVQRAGTMTKTGRLTMQYKT
jgi:hypothetical protein